MNKTTEEILNHLFTLRDPEYREFHSKLMPTVDKERILGIRTPTLRKYAKALLCSGGYEAFLNDLPHRYYEENNLHAFLIEGIRDFDECISALNAFLPYVDNWATCDSMRPRALLGDTVRLREAADQWIDSGKEYTVRYGIGIYMTYFLDVQFDEEVLTRISKIQSDEYYVKMMIAWFFATALAKRYESTLPYIENGALNTWVHNKTIRKAIESYRISNDKKDYLRTLAKK